MDREYVHPVLLDRILVKLRTWSDAAADRVARDVGGTVEIRIPLLGYLQIGIDPARAPEVFRALEAHPEVAPESVHFDAAIKMQAVAYKSITNDPMLPRQVHDALNVLGAWAETMGDPAVIVGIGDSGLTADYASWPEFAGKSITWIDQYQGGNSPTPVDHDSFEHHGTDVACVAVANANKGSGAAGIAPGCSLAMVSNPLTNFGSFASIMAALGPIGVAVISISASGDLPETPAQFASAYPSMVDAFDAVEAAGVLVFLAGGNESFNSDYSGYFGYPAAYAESRGHFSVAATTPYSGDQLVRYSNSGSGYNVAAPGNSNWVAFRKTTTARVPVPAGWVSPWGDGARSGTYTVDWTAMEFNGTSCATPQVAGVAGLVKSCNRALTWQELAACIKNTLRKAGDSFYEWMPATSGIPDAKKACRYAKAIGSKGTLFPYVRFFGLGVTTDFSSGTTYLRGALTAEITGLCMNTDGTADPIVSVQLVARDPSSGIETVLYSGGPVTTWDTLAPIAAANLVGKNVKVYATSASGKTNNEEFSDLVAVAISSTPPKTVASPVGYDPTPGLTITLAAQSENPPVETYYTWGPLLAQSAGGDWHLYSTPIARQFGVLRYYSKDALGNVEGGTDYAAT